ncbi:MAG TPA: diguanylate cyclase [Pseudidiomarina sp.]|nr:diguanylate cyclase [Pseudidiomarina sp.]
MRAQVLAGFVVPIVIVAGLSWVVSINMESVRKLADRSELLMREIAIRNDVLKTIISAETGERGFVITGNEEFLEPYKEAQIQFLKLTNDWNNLANSTAEANELKRIEELFQRWVDEVAEPAVAARSEFPRDKYDYTFQAFYHLNRLEDFLSAGGMLEAVKHEHQQYQSALQSLMAKSSSKEVRSTWGTIMTSSEQLDQSINDLVTTNPSSSLVNSISARVRQLEALWREITLDYRTAEGVSVALVASGQGKALVEEMRDIIQASLAEKNLLSAQVNAEVEERMRLLEWLSMYLPVVGVGIGLAILLFMQLGVISSIAKLQATARRLEGGDLSARVTETRSDELGILANDFNRMAEKLEMTQREGVVLAGFQAMLVSSNNEDEAYVATARALSKLLPPSAGALYLMAASRDYVELAISWGYNLKPTERFHPEDCRALRLGRTYRASKESAEIFCTHTQSESLEYSICIPLITRDEVLGTIVLAGVSEAHEELDERSFALAKTVAERLSLALSNIRLTEKLRSESVRDPLTGLYNRRYLEETLEREMQRVSRARLPLSVITADVDHFKRFNDTFGHEAGDRVLEELATQMVNIARPGDVVCRFGGEEFVIILPEASTEIASARAEELRRRIEMLDLYYGGTALGRVTISLGVASFPAHATKKEELLRLADNALYEAKNKGRNQVSIHPLHKA